MCNGIDALKSERSKSIIDKYLYTVIFVAKKVAYLKKNPENVSS